MATNKTVTVTVLPTLTGDTVASYNVYEGVSGTTLLGTMTPAEAAAGKVFAFTDGIVHSVKCQTVWTTAGASTLRSAGVELDLSASYILDQVTGSVGAWSLRALSSSTTNVVRVRRDNDNAELDFTAEQVTDGTLATWVGVNNGLVHTLYDQSGSANDMVNTNTAQQPILVTGGVVNLVNGKADVDFSFFNTSNLKGGQTLTSGLYSMHVVGNATAVGSGGNENLVLNHSGGTNVGRTQYCNIQDAVDLKNVTFFNNGASQAGAMTANWVNGQFSFSVYGDNSDYVVQRNGGTPETVITGQALAQETIGMSIGNYNAPTPTATNQWNGGFQELIVYNSNKSADKSTIEANINSYYSIY